MNELLVLQSGFVTPKISGYVTPENLTNSPIGEINSTLQHPITEYWYNQEIDRMYRAYTSDLNNNLADFEFRHQYLQEIIRAIDSVTFKSWVYQQIDSPRLNNTNAQFLLDTLNYIVGYKRSLDPISWDGLVGREVESVDRTALGRVLKCYFGDHRDTTIYNGPILPSGLTDVISQWASRPAGTRDLFLTMGAIFKRHKRLELKKMEVPISAKAIS